MVQESIHAINTIILDTATEEGRPFKARFLQAGLVKYPFGVCLLKKETIDKFINTFIDCPVVIGHMDNITSNDVKGKIKNVWFSSADGWFWCDGVLTDNEAIELVEQGYNISCQYKITQYIDNFGQLHNGNPYDKEILGGFFEHLAIVKSPRYEDAFIAVNAIMDEEAQCTNAETKAQNSILEKFSQQFKEALTKEVRRLGEFRARNEKPKKWITIKGNHIPIKEGQSKKDYPFQIFK